MDPLSRCVFVSVACLVALNSSLAQGGTEGGSIAVTRISGKPYPESTVAAASGRFNAGNDKLDARDYPGALADFRAAARLDPGFVKAVDMIAVTFRRLNQLDSAEHYYLKSIAMFPEGTFAYGNLAVVYLMRGEVPRAIERYRQQIALDPDDPEGHYGLGNAYLRSGKLDSAASSVMLAIDLYERTNNPHLSDGYLLLGIVFREAGDLGDAEESLAKALELGAKLPPELHKWYIERSVNGPSDGVEVTYTDAELKAVEPQVVEAAQLLLQTGPNHNPAVRKQAAQNVLAWITKTPTLTLEVTEGLRPIMEDADLLVVFIAAFAKTGIEGEGRLAKEDLYVGAMHEVREYYRQHRGELGQVDKMDELAGMSDEKFRKAVASWVGE